MIFVSPLPPYIFSLVIQAQETAPSADVLTLDTVLETVGASYPKIVGANAEKQAAVAKRREKRGAFDVTTSVGTEWTRYNSASARGKEYDSTVQTATAEMTLRSGVKFIAGRDLNSGVVKSPLSSTGSQGTFFAGVKVPLLRGRNLSDKVVGEQQAILGIPLSERSSDTVRLNALLGASVAYWDWAASGQKRAIAADLLQLSETRAAQIKRENELGALPDIAVVEAEQEVMRRKGSLVKADRDLQKSAFKLSAYLWNGNGTPGMVPHARQIPPNLPVPLPLAPEVIAAARERASRLRPELGTLDIQQDVFQWDAALAENDAKPDVSLTLQPGQDLGRKGIGDTMKAGIFFSVPLNRWEATGRRDAARAKLAKLSQDHALLRQQIMLEVDDAASAMNTSEARYQAAVQEVELALRLENGEKTRFRAGDSTLFLVNQRERATAESRARLVEIMAEYQQARAAFDAASVQLEPASAGTAPREERTITP